MFNMNQTKEFTKNLEELLAEGMTLYQSLMILSESRLAEKNISRASRFLAEQISEGNMLSVAIKKCPFLKFDRVYVSFIYFAERTGNLTETLKFLREREERYENTIHSILDAMVYPCFVVLLVVSILIFFFCNSGELFGISVFPGVSSSEFLRSIIWSLVTFILLGAAILGTVLFTLCDNSLYEAFLSGGFLVKNGMEFSSAVGMAAGVAGFDSRVGKLFVKAGERLEYGMDLRTAFCSSSGLWFRKKMELSLLMAEETGKKDEVFIRIADSIKKETDRKRKLCFSLIEPAFIVLTGVFLFGIVINLVLPVVTETGIL